MAEEHDLVLILSRGLASSIATPVFLVDPEGTLIYYNEAAEEILGQSYSESGPLPQQAWARMFQAKDPQSGQPVDPKLLPLAIALAEEKPAHAPLAITGLDGGHHTLEVTALPLFAKTDEFIGAMAIFWEEKP